MWKKKLKKIIYIFFFCPISIYYTSDGAYYAHRTESKKKKITQLIDI